MKREFVLLGLLFAFVVLFFAGCAQVNSSSLDSSEVALDNQIFVVTFYPVQEITEAIALDSAEVLVLVPVGVDPHSYEPTPTQVVSLSKADVFIVMGGGFENIEEKILDANSDIKMIDATHTLELVGENEDYNKELDEDEHRYDESEEDEQGHDDKESNEYDSEEYDPHVWLSIHNMEKMTREIEEHLSEMYPQNAQIYSENSEVYLEKLRELEEEFDLGLSNCSNDKIIVNHKAFGYLANEYGFEQVSISGFSPQSEPSPKTIQRVINVARENNLKYIFSEGQLDPKTAQTIANDIGAEVLELNPLKMNENEDYFSIMRGNLNNLKIGLDCHMN